ncbi:MAG: hypothetical protein F6K16_06680 [Symploca sp. SIO2B6]|nr:hypothetical protein [Symploca sp. SIO2B6]
MTLKNRQKLTNYIYAPNIHLFAFHLRHGSNLDESKQLWHQCDQIFQKLEIRESSNTYLQLSKYLDLERQPYLRRTELLKNNQTSLSFTSQVVIDNSALITKGFAYPVRIGDSYGLWLNIRCPERDENNQPTEDVEIKFFGALNPDNCLIFKNSPYFLGQTILVTAWLNLEHKQQQNQNQKFLKSLADQCLNSLIAEPAIRPSLYRQSELFGSPIFEYGLVTQTTNYCHIIVWLFRQPETDKKFNFCYQQLLDLFLYRNKIIKAFHNRLYVYQKLEKKYEAIEKMIDEIEAHNTGIELEATELKQFKIQLKAMPKLAIEYTRWLRLLEDYRNTIEINTHNYEEKIEQIRINTSEENLTFLEHFIQKNCVTFQEQITGDLNYFIPGTGLLDQAIASIRGIVEIDQAERDRQNQEAAQLERDRREKADNELQIEIAASGLAIATGALVASSSGLMTQKWEWPGSPKSTGYPHPFLISLFLSLILALCTYGLTKRLRHLIK